MSKFAFIGTFILGGITGIGSMFLLAKRISNLTRDELSHTGSMLIEGGHNRESAFTLTKTNGENKTFILKKK